MVQRLGEDTANNEGGEVLFDSVNFRPAAGVTYGFTYYHRRNSILQFLQPGFGANLALMSWNDRLRNVGLPGGSDLSKLVALKGSRIQLGVGAMGSMFDNTVVAVFGWNLNVKDHRPYFAIGVSVTGLVRTMAGAAP